MKVSRVLPPLSSAALLLLAGCAVGPDYRRPVVSAPEAFKEQQGLWKPAQPLDQLPRGKWWEEFGDPVLNELQAKIEVSSNTLQAAEAQYRQALAAASISNAGLFPSISANGSGERAKTGGRNGNSGSIGNTFAAGLSASWEFDLWGRVRRTSEAGRAGAQASEADLENVRLSLHATLAQSYFALRAADAQGALYSRQAEGYRRFLQITENRYKQGIALRSDVAAALSQLKSTEAQLIDLKLQRSQLEHAIAVLLGQPPAAFSIAPGDLAAKLPEVPAVLPSQLLERRPDIAAAERRLAAASAQIGVATGGFFPTISLGGSGGYQSSQSGQLFSAPSQVWSFGASASMPLFDTGKVYFQVKQARAAFEASAANYRQTVLGAFQEVEDYLSATAFLAEEAKVQNEAVEAARLSASISLNQYQAGTVTYLNVVTAMATQLSAERNAVEVLQRRLTASVQLYKAVGGGWSRNASDKL